MVTSRQAFVGAIVLVAVTAVLTRYYWPRIETQEVTVEKEVVKKDVRTVVREIVRPDGTTERNTEIIDRTRERIDRSQTITQYKQSDWVVSLGAYSDRLQDGPHYGLVVQRRVLGPAFVGLSADTEQRYGVIVGWEF